MIQRAAIATTLALTCAVGLGGYIKGRADNEAKHIATNAAAVLLAVKQAAVTAKLQRETAEELQAQSKRNDQLLRDYDYEVANNSDAASCAPSPDSLRQFRSLTAAAKARSGQ